MPASTKQKAPRRLLWVEGKDDRAVVKSLCNLHQIPETFDVRETAGITDLFRGLPVEIRAPDLECFGVVVDANGDVAARWAAIRDLLREEAYTGVPDRPVPGGVVLPGPPGRPRFGAWIMPDNASPGMLEDFAGALVPADDFLWSYAAEVIDAIPGEHRRFTPNQRSKAQIHTWLAWQEGPGSPMGQAITKGDLDATAPDAQRFVGWLRRLFVEDVPPS